MLKIFSIGSEFSEWYQKKKLEREARKRLPPKREKLELPSKFSGLWFSAKFYENSMKESEDLKEYHRFERGDTLF